MQIEERIKELQRIKEKIDAFRYVIKYVEDVFDFFKETKESFPGLKEEFTQEIRDLCNARIEALGNPVKDPESKRKVEKVLITEAPVGAAQKDLSVSAQEDPRDPLSFLMKYKYLDGKRVELQTQHGAVQGKVVGMVVPDIVIETDLGYSLKVKPRELKEIK